MDRKYFPVLFWFVFCRRSGLTRANSKGRNGPAAYNKAAQWDPSQSQTRLPRRGSSQTTGLRKQSKLFNSRDVARDPPILAGDREGGLTFRQGKKVMT